MARDLGGGGRPRAHRHRGPRHGCRAVAGGRAAGGGARGSGCGPRRRGADRRAQLAVRAGPAHGGARARRGRPGHRARAATSGSASASSACSTGSPTRGIEAQFPEEAAARTRLGKFYHRPPGGESWCDVGLRVRSALDSIAREHQGERVLLVAHQVVIFMFRYVIEHLDEAQILAISRQEELVNCSVTTLRARPTGRPGHGAGAVQRDGRPRGGRGTRDRRGRPGAGRSGVTPTAPLLDEALLAGHPLPDHSAARASTTGARCSWSEPPPRRPARCCSPGSLRCASAPDGSRSPRPTTVAPLLAVRLPEAQVMGFRHRSTGTVTPSDRLARSDGRRRCGPRGLGARRPEVPGQVLLEPRRRRRCAAMAAWWSTRRRSSPSVLGAASPARSPSGPRAIPNPGEAVALGRGTPVDEDPGTAVAELVETVRVCRRASRTVDVDRCASRGPWSSVAVPIGLGTSGSGDVLAGMVAGHLARGADPITRSSGRSTSMLRQGAASSSRANDRLARRGAHRRHPGGSSERASHRS